MSSAIASTEKGFTVAVLLIQLIATVTVWFLNTSSVQSEKLFALFTAVNLVSFAMVSYLFRKEGAEGRAVQAYLYLGLLMIFVLLAVSLFV